MSDTRQAAVAGQVRAIEGYPASDTAIARMATLQDGVAALRAVILSRSLFDTEPAQLGPALERLAEKTDD